MEMRSMHCSACGGGLEAGSASCDYCGAEFSIMERRLGEACPECFARTLHGARFCGTCGVGLNPEIVEITPLSTRCPRCKGPMARRTLENGNFTECNSCGGIWLAESAFEDLVVRRDEATLAAFLGKTPGDEVDEVLQEMREETVRYVPCPECGEMMNRKNFARCSGVIIDWCKGHGYWFDTCELDKIMAWIQGGGLDRARKMQIRRRGKPSSLSRMWYSSPSFTTCTSGVT